MNVVFFVNNLNSGGIENYLLRFLRSKHKEFSEIYVYCKSGETGQLLNNYEDMSNIHIIKNHIGYLDYKGYKSVKSFLVDKNISIVCDFTGNFAGIILLAAYKSKVPKRITFYRGSTDRFNKNVVKNIYNDLVKYLVKSYATDILSNSNAGFNYFFDNQWHDDSRFNVIYNGINHKDFLASSCSLRKELNIPESAFVIGHTGRFDRAKNHKTIIDVAEFLVKASEDIYFIMCGNGVKNNLFDDLIERGIADKVLVFENRTDLPDFLTTMDCYYFPSITEGQPNSLIEALIVGLPFVVSNIAPILEVIPYECRSQAIDPNDIEKAVYKILEIKNSKTLQAELNISDWASKKFDSDKLFTQFYDKLLN